MVRVCVAAFRRVIAVARAQSELLFTTGEISYMPAKECGWFGGGSLDSERDYFERIGFIIYAQTFPVHNDSIQSLKNVPSFR